jgi:hypothetical protein
VHAENFGPLESSPEANISRARELKCSRNWIPLESSQEAKSRANWSRIKGCFSYGKFASCELHLAGGDLACFQLIFPDFYKSQLEPLLQGSKILRRKHIVKTFSRSRSL